MAVDFGGVRAVDGAHLSAEPGAIVGLIGPNGSGKTTMLDVISGLVTPKAGSVRLDGETLEEYLPEERASLGVVRSFQDCRLFPELTVEDVLLLTLDARRPVAWSPRPSRCRGPATPSGPSGPRSTRSSAPSGSDRFRRHRISQLSTGTRRVVDLASIVLARPRLLLLDEPTAGIAQREAEAFVPLLRRLHEVADTTIVLVEHDVPLVFALCTQVVMMESGTVVSSGTPDEVAARPPGGGRLPRGQRGGPGRVRCGADVGCRTRRRSPGRGAEADGPTEGCRDRDLSGPPGAGGRVLRAGHGRAEGDVAPQGHTVGDAGWHRRSRRGRSAGWPGCPRRPPNPGPTGTGR